MDSASGAPAACSRLWSCRPSRRCARMESASGAPTAKSRVWSCEPSRRWATMESANGRSTAKSRAWSCEPSRSWATMEDVGRVVIDHRPVLPVESPVAPSPPNTTEETHSESHAKGHSWSGEIEPRRWIPAGQNCKWCAIHDPRIVLWDVDNIRVYRFNHDSLPLCCYFLLWSARQLPRALRTSTHDLHRIHHILRLVGIGASER